MPKWLRKAVAVIKVLWRGREEIARADKKG